MSDQKRTTTVSPPLHTRLATDYDPWTESPYQLYKRLSRP